MTHFKVGDRVRQVKDYMWRGIEGVYDGRRCGDNEFSDSLEWDYFIPDEGSHYSNGDPCTFAGKPCGMAINSFELVKPDRLTRLEAFVARVASDEPGGRNRYREEAKALVAEIAPIDADLIEARKIAMDEYQPLAWNDEQWESRVMAGDEDEDRSVRSALAGIRRGRALERGEP